MNDSNSTANQRNKILEFLRICPLDTLTARTELDVMHPAARVLELKKVGEKIQTVKIDRASNCREIHRVACYVLEVGAVAPAPADETAGTIGQQTDKQQDSTEGYQ